MTLEDAERFQVEHERAGRVDAIAQRLEYLRAQIQAESISYSELAELQTLAEYIEPGDVELLEWAGVPEFPAEDDSGWHVGYNIPGYLPESEPYHLTGWKNAAEALADEMERSLEFLADGEAEAQILDEYTEALEELKALIEAGEPGELGWVLPLSGSEHDLGYSYWVVQCQETGCAEWEDEEL